MPIPQHATEASMMGRIQAPQEMVKSQEPKSKNVSVEIKDQTSTVKDISAILNAKDLHDGKWGIIRTPDEQKALANQLKGYSGNTLAIEVTLIERAKVEDDDGKEDDYDGKVKEIETVGGHSKIMFFDNGKKFIMLGSNHNGGENGTKISFLLDSEGKIQPQYATSNPGTPINPNIEEVSMEEYIAAHNPAVDALTLFKSELEKRNNIAIAKGAPDASTINQIRTIERTLINLRKSAAKLLEEVAKKEAKAGKNK
jgi:hypothetical protein